MEKEKKRYAKIYDYLKNKKKDKIRILSPPDPIDYEVILQRIGEEGSYSRLPVSSNWVSCKIKNDKLRCKDKSLNEVDIKYILSEGITQINNEGNISLRGIEACAIGEKDADQLTCVKNWKRWGDIKIVLPFKEQEELKDYNFTLVESILIGNLQTEYDVWEGRKKATARQVHDLDDATQEFVTIRDDTLVR